jgi:hypothetical protein
MSPSLTWKSRLRNALPKRWVEELLLALPFLYGTRLVRYETNMAGGGGLEDLLSQLDGCLEVDGDVVECGSDLAGTTIIMAKHLERRGKSKRIHACDSFRGFDPEELEREKSRGWAAVRDDRFTQTSVSYVTRKLERLRVADRVRVVPGFFQDTLEAIDGPLCFVFIDCDLKDSLVYCAETLWPRLASGGRMVFDDYAAPHFKGAKIGIDEFVERHASEIADHGFLRRTYFALKR